MEPTSQGLGRIKLVCAYPSACKIVKHKIYFYAIITFIFLGTCMTLLTPQLLSYFSSFLHFLKKEAMLFAFSS